MCIKFIRVVLDLSKRLDEPGTGFGSNATGVHADVDQTNQWFAEFEGVRKNRRYRVCIELISNYTHTHTYLRTPISTDTSSVQMPSAMTKT